MRDVCVHARRFVLPRGVVREGYLLIEGGRFSSFTAEKPVGVGEGGVALVDEGDAWVAPGLVDTHIHGFFGHATTDEDAEGIRLASEELARRGTTTWLPTTFTDATDAIARQCAAIARAASGQSHDGDVAAHVGGIFLEGPFFTLRHAGAQNPEFLCDPSVETLRRWQDVAEGRVVKSAFAPERCGAAAYAGEAARAGVVAAIAHTDATYEQCLDAVAAGATVFVHTYNGMRGLHHREPGVVGAAMTTRDTYAEVICDGLHVRPGAVAALVAAKGWDHVVLITDCLGCGGLPDGDYMSGGLPVEMRDGACYLKEGGNLAGSILTLAEAVRNVCDWGVVGPEQALRMATEVPARACGIAATCGAIEVGREADLAVFSGDLELRATYVGGERLAATSVPR